MVSLGQKLKFPKTCEKRLYNHIRILLRRKRLQKTPIFREMTIFSKSQKLPTMPSVAAKKWSQKHPKNDATTTLDFSYVKKRRAILQRLSLVADFQNGLISRIFRVFAAVFCTEQL